MSRRCRVCKSEVPSDKRATRCPGCGVALDVAPTLPTGMPAVADGEAAQPAGAARPRADEE